VLFNGVRKNNQLQYSYIQIKEILMLHNGFRIILDPSEIVLTFICNDSTLKNQIVKLMKDNARNFVEHELSIASVDSTNCVVVIIKIKLILTY
jgi:hypothetical protein